MTGQNLPSRRQATRRVSVQRDQDWLETAAPEQVEAAMHAGQLASVAGTEAPFEIIQGVQWSNSDLDQATPDQIADALDRGDLREVLAGSPPVRQWTTDDFDAASDSDRWAAYRSGALAAIDEEHGVTFDGEGE